MNLQTQRLSLRGPSGEIEALRDDPSGPCKGVAVISHPHPLFGGTMDNKVVQTLARAFVQSGWSAVRFNFRGVGQSAGQYDEGRGELDDLLAVVSQQAGSDVLALAGFSFGAFVTAQAASQLAAQRQVEHLVLVGTAASRFQVPLVPQDLHDRTLVIHGEHDDTVPLSAVMDWARAQTLPVLVVPGGGHFFHGQLPLLKSRVMRHLGV
jgi:alpha/beta superfamily hydrolase